jgi:hypothetical protein
MRVGANCIEFGVYNSSQKHAAKLPMALCSFTTMLTTAPICQQCWHSRIVEHLGPPAIRPFMPLLKHVIAAYLTDPGNHCMQQCHNCNKLRLPLGSPQPTASAFMEVAYTTTHATFMHQPPRLSVRSSMLQHADFTSNVRTCYCCSQQSTHAASVSGVGSLNPPPPHPICTQKLSATR